MCSEACAQGRDYRLFGWPLEAAGFILFGLVALTYAFGWPFLTLLLFMGALGGEAMLIYIQKVEMGHWCPVCLSIAATIMVGAGALLYQEFSHKGISMFQKALTLVTVFALGLFSTFLGISKMTPLEAVEQGIIEKIKMGNPQSTVDVYIFTDWACPACDHLEPTFEALVPKILPHARVTYVDFVVHPETLNFAPYNLSFMVANQKQYLAIRKALKALAKTNKKPQDAQIEAAVAPLGIKLQELPFSDVTASQNYFEELGKKYHVDSTPTIVITNQKKDKARTLVGNSEITEENILEAIDNF